MSKQHRVWVAECLTHDGSELLSVHLSEQGARASCADHADGTLAWQRIGSSRSTAELDDYQSYFVRELVLRE